MGSGIAALAHDDPQEMNEREQIMPLFAKYDKVARAYALAARRELGTWIGADASDLPPLHPGHPLKPPGTASGA